MRRTIILLALALCGGLLSSCGKGGHTTSGEPSAVARSSGAGEGPSVTKRQALAFANAVNLTADDVPGFKPSSKRSSHTKDEHELERQMLQCAGLGGSRKAIVEQGSEDFQLKRQIIDFGVSSEVSVEPSAAQARRGLAAIRSAHVRGCFTRYLDDLFKSDKFAGATVGPVKIQSGIPPAPGTSGGFGWRVTATFTVRGIDVPIYLDFLGFVDGQAQVTLLSSGLLRPFPAEVQQRLFALLLARAKEHSLLSRHTWTAVDDYLAGQLIGADPALDATLQATAAAGIPAIAVSPAQGKLLHLLARSIRAERILEIGTLGGYSTIWLARALPSGGRVVTLEANPQYAALAQANIERAGLSDVVVVRVGRGLDTLPQIAAEDDHEFDLIFIDADKPSTPDYFAWALELSHPGSLIIADNVVRDGAVGDPATDDAAAQGSRRFHEMLAADRSVGDIGQRVSATTIQTVGVKGYDGFTLALVNDR